MKIKINYIENKENFVFRRFSNLLITEEALDFIRENVMRNEIEKLGFKIYHKEHHGNSDDPDDYEPVDFSIADSEDNVAWVWGSHPTNDVMVECNHPNEVIDWGDDDECGECLLCGDQCVWHWEKGQEYEGTDEYGNVVSSEYGSRVIDEWHHTSNKGLIGKYLKEMAKEF